MESFDEFSLDDIGVSIESSLSDPKETNYRSEAIVSAYQRVRDTLDSDQSELVSTLPEHHIQAASGAGSGKSYATIARALNLVLNHNVKPSSIVLISFTNKAAKELQTRYQRFFEPHLAPSALESMETPSISTIHSFGYRTLKRIAGQHLTLKSDGRCKTIIRSILKEIWPDVKIEAADVNRIHWCIGQIQSANESFIFSFPQITAGYQYRKTVSWEAVSPLMSGLTEVVESQGFRRLDQIPVAIEILKEKGMLTDEQEHNLASFLRMANFSFTGHSIRLACLNPKSDGSVEEDEETFFKYLTNVESYLSILHHYASQAQVTIRDMVRIHTKYMEELYSTASGDFAAMQQALFFYCIQNPGELEKVWRDYKHVIIDEAQDTDTLNFAMGLIATESAFTDLRLNPLDLMFMQCPYTTAPLMAEPASDQEKAMF